ncbi:MAG: DUF5686 family protein [bacterium]
MATISKAKLILILFLFQFCLAESQTHQNTYSIYGEVSDNSSGDAIPGATIKVVNSNKGTYSSTRGKFKIPFLTGKNKLKIMSIGYETQFVDVDETIDTVRIQLVESAVKLKEATVIGNIEPKDVIKRAIERKQENQQKISTFKGLLYSKVVMELDGNVFGSTSGNSISIGGSLGTKAPEQYKMFVLETFTRMYSDYEKNVNFKEIIQRRQTANIKPNDNVMAISNFFNLYKDEVDFINVNFVTPLSKDALDYYNYKILKKNILDNRYIYEIQVMPKTDIFPLFKGMIKIVEGTYNLIELDLEPSESTAIAFMDSLHIIQKFEEIKENMWHPSLLEITGKARVDIIKGIIDVKLNAKASSIYSEMEVNVLLPDSIYLENVKKLTVAPLADSSKIEYWEKNSLRDISEREKMMYVKVDSLVAVADTLAKDSSKIRYSILNPYFDFNRVTSVSIGLSPWFQYDIFYLYGSAAFSFGLQKPVGSIGLQMPFKLFEKLFFVSGNLFSKAESDGYYGNIPMLINTVSSSLFHYDYYDYFKKDGWSIVLSVPSRQFSFDLMLENSRCFSLEKNTDRSIFTKKYWRNNPQIDDGNFLSASGSMNLYLHRIFKFYKGFEMNLYYSFIYGENQNDKETFNRNYISIKFETPTFQTGYNPLKLELFLDYGIGNNLPVQEQFKARGSLLFISKFGNFCTMPFGIYEEKSAFTGHIKYNFTDIWWRWLGFPLYEGRGLDLIGRASTGKFETAFNSKEWYSEAGFGFERIPTFISNIFYFGAGAVWGTGPIASGRFNWYLDITLPF